MALNWHVGDVVRKLRDAADKTQEKLAAEVKIRPATISAIERTGKYDPETLEKIAPALKTTVAEIYALVPTATAPEGAEHHVICCASHQKQHVMLNEILHSGKEDLIDGITVNLRSLSSSATGRPYSSEPQDVPASGVRHGAYGFDRRPRKR